MITASPRPIGTFRNYLWVNDLLFVSGQGPREADGLLHTGKVGRDLSVADAYGDARLTGQNLLAVVKDAVGDLIRVRQVVKLFGMVNATPEFTQHPAVIDGCSDLFVEVFGSFGEHARSAIGVASLPNNITVEIEAIFDIRP